MEGFLKTSRYGSGLKLVMHSILDKLCNRRYKASLSQIAVSDRVHKRGRIGEGAEPHLQLRVDGPLSIIGDIETLISLLKDRFSGKQRSQLSLGCSP